MSDKKVLPTPAPPPQNVSEKRVRPPFYSWFACVLYPEFDEDHAYILHYLGSLKGLFPKIVYINHDSDVDENGEHKKNHVHVLFYKALRTRVSSMSKHLLGIHVEGVNDWQSYAAYMLHSTPDSRNKHLYDISELKGDESIIGKLRIGQNSNFVSLKEVSDAIKVTGGRIYEAITLIGQSSNIDSNLETLRRYSGILATMANQEFRLSNSSYIRYPKSIYEFSNKNDLGDFEK